MLSKFETIGIAISIFCMAGALFLLNRTDDEVVTNLATSAEQAAVVVVSDDGTEASDAARARALVDATGDTGRLQQVVVDDVIIGGGSLLEEGSTASVHYIGRLQNGQEFDNSYERGIPFSFTVGAGEVIPGWDAGLLGMREGGQRILVVPPQFAYGSQGFGPIPGNATLVFSVELLSIE